MRAALLQLNSQENLTQNFAMIDALLHEASLQNAEYALLPENFSFFGSEKEKLVRQQEISEETILFLKNSAQKYKMIITGGGFPVPTGNGKVFNSALTLSPTGEAIHRYDKLHLFDATPGDNATYRESHGAQAGNTIAPLLTIGEFSLGVTICYDLRFPYLYRALALSGATAFLVPAAFTELTGKAHWHTLLRSRAIENTCYVLAAAQCGEHVNGRRTFGHSMLVDPWGKIVKSLSDEPGTLVVDLSLPLVESVRKRMPSLLHGRSL
ncbi:MAG TPA: carbon-nitrogen hydrolase family protein [Turneriella sp.]|nr:carbon-nitrogen hydrolase family protein [Turneriella sp.]